MTAVPPAGQLTVSKLHGLGNDFLIALNDDAFADPGMDADLARRLCDRHQGIGADGCILGTRLPGAGANPGAVDPHEGRAASCAVTTRPDRPLLRFQLWNADGSEAEMSGNGIRCLAHAALDAGWVPEGVAFGVLTPAGRRQVTVRRGAEDGSTWGQVEMGAAKVRGEADRCNVGHGQLLVDIGNPHLVVLGPDPATVDVAALGPTLEASDPARLNVEFVALGPGPDALTMRVWERGVGETRACGTGACAAATALHHWGRVGRAVTVHQAGGAAAVELHPDGTVTLAGPSVHIATCWTRR
jgi:diaminopimelate epimerase